MSLRRFASGAANLVATLIAVSIVSFLLIALLPGDLAVLILADAATPERVAALRDVWQLVGRLDAVEVLIDDRPLPFARELWLPLLWYLLPR